LAVFVLDKRKKPPMPCSDGRARLPAERGRVVIRKRYSFTIRLKDQSSGRGDGCRTNFDRYAFAGGDCRRETSGGGGKTGGKTGGMARAEPLKGEHAGIRVAAGPCRLLKAGGTVAGHGKLLDRAGGDGYDPKPAPPPATEVPGCRRGVFL
jgi:hypothetical protein